MTLRGQRRGGRFPRWTGWTCLTTASFSPDRTCGPGLARPGAAELLVAGAEFALGYLGAEGPGLPGRLRVRLLPGDGNALDEIRAPSRLVARGPGG